MEMVAGRVPDDLYQWFASLQLERAVTSSDKLRVLLAQLKRQYEGALDYVSALSWFRDVTGPLRQARGILERDEGKQSEVVTTLVEHLNALAATLVSAQPKSEAEAIVLEQTIVRRVFAMTEALLRQAVTTNAAAFDPKVVHKHCRQTIELAKLVKEETT
ncbi:MAG TPA: hypothetical protein VGK73_19980 [Polyangiaceae bacterium]